MVMQKQVVRLKVTCEHCESGRRRCSTEGRDKCNLHSKHTRVALIKTSCTHQGTPALLQTEKCQMWPNIDIFNDSQLNTQILPDSNREDYNKMIPLLSPLKSPTVALSPRSDLFTMTITTRGARKRKLGLKLSWCHKHPDLIVALSLTSLPDNKFPTLSNSRFCILFQPNYCLSANYQPAC